MTRTEISDLFGRHQSAKQIGQALLILMKNGRVEVCREIRTKGRPKEVWMATKRETPK
jgi:hypothetical protein